MSTFMYDFTPLNGTISAMTETPDAIYIGGDFTTYAKNSDINTVLTAQRIVKISKATGLVDTTFNTSVGFSDGTVHCIIADSSGNIYASGSFTSYKGNTRQRIVKINANTAAIDTAFNSTSGFDGIPYALALDSSGNLYAGGSFNAYKGNSYPKLVKLNANTAALDASFNTANGFNNDINSIALDSSGNIYVAGFFTSYKGTACQRIAKLNKIDGSLITEFNSSTGFDSYVSTIAIDSSGNLYAVGGFNSYKSIARAKIAKLNGINANLDTVFDTSTGFNAFTAEIVLDSSENVYVSGGFTSYKNIPRQRIAKLNKTTAALDTTFDSEIGFNNTTTTIFTSSSQNLYIGGSFTTYKNVAASRFITLNTITAAIRYKPQVNNVVVVGSVVVGVIEVNPTTTAILVNEQPLPVNSVVKSTSGQKFIKVEGGATAFVAIEVIPPTEWGWSQEGLDAWAVLQNL